VARRNFADAREPKRTEKQMSDDDIRLVREKVESFMKTAHVSLPANERWVRFQEHCGMGVAREYRGQTQLHMWPGNYEVWADRISHYEKSGGRYDWAKPRKAG
jgi:hypothetical protein